MRPPSVDPPITRWCPPQAWPRAAGLVRRQRPVELRIGVDGDTLRHAEIAHGSVERHQRAVHFGKETGLSAQLVPLGFESRHGHQERLLLKCAHLQCSQDRVQLFPQSGGAVIDPR